ncbi:hypothetical protein Q1695_016160 [Nippostrongylus brasiliensis]|nr:hypothetical protein Q1695_016160 [Nippostrongylus brasiliensis]
MTPQANEGRNVPHFGIRYGENLRVSVAANQGGRKYMEDRVHIETVRDEDGSIKFTFFGIFDGHGGHEASEYVRRNLLNNIMKNEMFDSDDDDDILEAIRLGFLATHHGIWKVVAEWPRTASGYPSTAGTTVSIAILRNGKLYSGHVGDSAIILLKRAYRKDNSEDLIPHRLTVDHKPESEDEQTRIRIAGGSVALKSGVARVVWTRPMKHHTGPVRRSTPTESIPFLAVARSLGDVWSYCEDTKEFVVSPEPDLAVQELTGDDVCLVLASDGLTNVLGPIQVAAIVDEEESVSQIGVDRCEDLVYRLKHTNLARVLVANAFRNWRHLRADNVTAIAVMLDSPYADLPLDHPCVEECIGINESIDKVFIDDPECIVRICPTSTLKLFTYRTPILYKGARDPNFSVVDYTGPGFITHTEERLIEEHYRAAYMESEDNNTEVLNSIEIDSVVSLCSPMDASITFPDVSRSLSETNNSDVSEETSRAAGRNTTPVVTESHSESIVVCSNMKTPVKRPRPSSDDDDGTDEEEEAGASTLPVVASKVSEETSRAAGRNTTPVVTESHSESIVVCSNLKTPVKRPRPSNDDDDGTDEEEEAGASTSPVVASKRSPKSPTQMDAILKERRITRSAARSAPESRTSPRPVTVAVRRSSGTITKRGPCRSSCVNVEDKVMTPSGSVDIKIHVDSSLTPTFGMITRSRDRSSTTLVVDVRTPPPRTSEKRSAACRLASENTSHNPTTPLTASRKRSHRELVASSGITPVVHRLDLNTPGRSAIDNNDDGIVAAPAKVRSAPSTPSKIPNGANRTGSKWSLSKLDERASLSETAVANLTMGEPPSKMRRIYGFMRRLVGFGLGNTQ